MTNEIQGINVAPSSTSGHYIQESKKVINLDNVNETFLVVGKSKLVTKNHESLSHNKTCLITTQQVFNPLTRLYEKSKD